jgi:hypothetical protein
VARARGTGAPGQVAIVALAIFNPLVRSALVYGHPEEILTTAFAVAAVACAAERRAMAAAVLVGLAMASKQWAVLALFGVLAMLDGERVRVCAVAVAVAAACSLPAVVLAPASFVDNQLGLAAARYRSPAALTWLFLLAPAGVRHLSSGLVASGPRLGSAVAGLLHPLIIALGAVIALFMRRRGGARSPRDALLPAVALAFLLRCTLDPATMPYYHLPLLATLLAWDALGGGRLPLRGLAATAIAYLVFDRLTPAVIGPDTSSALYDAVTLGIAVLLVRALAAARGRGTPAPRAVGLRPPRPAL